MINLGNVQEKAKNILHIYATEPLKMISVSFIKTKHLKHCFDLQ